MHRAGRLKAAAVRLEADTDKATAMIVAEMGKTYRAAQEEVGKCVRGLRFYADHGPGFMPDVAGSAPSPSTRVRRDRGRPLSR
ncbi:aldehyde dehydrogenase family protein [Streptomyces siamensis]|uniref:Aldehyde dehydrogenase domain-containing protein n=1 Tax=Streptomyces siamensis TaxID=1274986 RepID=A0ABP9JEQ3_9ACTN